MTDAILIESPSLLALKAYHAVSSERIQQFLSELPTFNLRDAEERLRLLGKYASENNQLDSAKLKDIDRRLQLARSSLQ